MSVHHVTPTFASARMAMAAGGAALVLGLAAPASATPYEANLASESQALTYCQSGTMGTNDIGYISSSTGAVQFGPGYNCVQKKATKKDTKTITTAVLVDGSGTVSECKLARQANAVALCNSGGIGLYDIDYISGKLYKTIGGQGYSCDIVKHVGGIGNAICK